MWIFQPKWWKVNPRTGKRVERTSPTWWVGFRDGEVRRRVSLRTTDKEAAQQLAREVVRVAAHLRSGLIPNDPTIAQRARPLAEHIGDFIASVGRSASKGHAADRRKALEEFARDTGAASLNELDGSKADRWLEEVAARTTRLGGTRSARDVNRRCLALRQFSRWLVSERRILVDPFLKLKRLDEESDRRHVRRALKPAEVAALLAAAARRPVAELEDRARREAEDRAKTGKAKRRPTRVSDASRARAASLGRLHALVYALATATGLRRGELGRLRWQDLVLDGGKRGLVRVPAASAKSGKDQDVPLRPDLLASLRAEREIRKREQAPDLVIPPKAFPSLRCFAADLKAAGIVRTGEDGRVVDFHALRTTFVSSLAAAGVHPRIAQALARHSSIELTMKAYTDLSLLDLQGAIDSTAPGIVSRTLLRKSGSPAGTRRSVPLGTPRSARAQSATEGPQSATGARSENEGKECRHLELNQGPTAYEALDAAADDRSENDTASTTGATNRDGEARGAGPAGPGTLSRVVSSGCDSGALSAARRLLELAEEADDPGPLLEAARLLLEAAAAAPLPRLGPASSRDGGAPAAPSALPGGAVA